MYSPPDIIHQTDQPGVTNNKGDRGWDMQPVKTRYFVCSFEDRSSFVREVTNLIKSYRLSREVAVERVCEALCRPVVDGETYRDYMSIDGGSSGSFFSVSLMYSKHGLIGVDDEFKDRASWVRVHQ